LACALLAVATTPSLAASGAADNVSARRQAAVASITTWFSPNGDGRLDVAVLDYKIPGDGTVSVDVRRAHRTYVLESFALGEQEGGRHRWTWDGRIYRKQLLAGAYDVSVTFNGGLGPSSTVRTHIDTTYDASVRYDWHGGPNGNPLTVYPRTTDVVDVVTLYPYFEATRRTTARLVIRDATGRRVLARSLELGSSEAVPWTGRRHGRPLAPGRYRARISGKDHAGNRGHSPWLRLHVSSKRLVLVNTPVRLPADTTPYPWPCALGGGGNDCEWYWSTYSGTVTPSALFPGGLSYVSYLCPEGSTWEQCHEGAVAMNVFRVPEAVHGLRAYRLAFTGAPTHRGEDDPGHLAYGHDQVLVSGTGAQGDWVTDAPLMDGQPAYPYGRLPPVAMWSFATWGDDAFDVAGYTLDLEYLALPAATR